MQASLIVTEVRFINVATKRLSGGKNGANRFHRKCCNFGRRLVIACAQVCSGCQIEEVVDELNLPKQIISCHSSNLSLPDHVDCFVALNGSPGRLKFSEALLGVSSTFDGSMILFENVIQVPHGSVSTAIAQRSFLLTIGNCGAVNRG